MNQHSSAVPSVTAAQMAEVDRLMTEVFHIDLVQMMENAGRLLARLAADRFLSGSPVGKAVAVLAGTGGNGGGALVCARRLHAWGAAVQIVLTKPPEAFKDVPAHQLQILQALRLPVLQASSLPAIGRQELLVDGLVGYRLSGSPHGTVAMLIEWANTQEDPVLALDIPSGMDATTGQVYPPAIKATATMTLALPKTGLLHEGAKPYVGELYLADIGVPPVVYAQPSLGLEVGPLFSSADLIRLR